MKQKLLKSLKIILPLALGVFLISYTYNKFSAAQLQQITSYFKNANYTYIFLSILFGVLSHISRAYRWNFMLEPLGYKPRLGNSIMAVFIGYLMNITIPRSGEVSRALIINRYDNIPFNKAFGTIITERAIDFFILLTIIATAFIVEFDTINNFIIQKTNPQKLLKLTIIILAVILIILIFIFKTRKTISKKIFTFLIGVKEGLFSVLKMKKKIPFIIHTLLIWVLYILMFSITIFALKETATMSFGTILTAFIVGSIAIVFTNSGFGTYPFLIAEILLLYNIPETAGTAFGWLVWTAQFLMIIFFGSLSFILLPLYNKKTPKK